MEVFVNRTTKEETTSLFLYNRITLMTYCLLLVWFISTHSVHKNWTSAYLEQIWFPNAGVSG
jgi:hypothetical protein